MDTLATLAAKVVICGIPLLMLAFAVLPYGRRFAIVNGAFGTVLCLGVLHEVLSHPSDLYGEMITVYACLLLLWGLIVHGTKALTVGVRHLLRRRSGSTNEPACQP